MEQLDLKRDVENFQYTNDDPIASMIPYMLEGVAYALDIKAKPSLRKHIAAAIVSYKTKAPFDDVLTSMNDSDYSDENSLSSYAQIRDMVVEGSYMASKIVYRYFQENFEKTSKKASSAQELFIFSMGRLSASFKAAVLLLNSGFFVEVSSILRLIYEQLSWGCYLVQETDDTKIEKNRTQSNVNYLKSALKREDYGRLYGYLSKDTHLEPDSISKYLSLDTKNGIISVKNRSGEKCDGETVVLLILLKMFGEVIWHGMNQFGFTETQESYFKDWFGVHLLLCENLKEALDGEISFESII